jgi:hypothetical protein
MEIEFTQRAFKDLQDWKKSGNKKSSNALLSLPLLFLRHRLLALVNPNP